ncbi:MAG: MBL fold metallo-hydrolase [Burkholderiales bacterium]|nr:MAG: MBL fold metallo-hydrolase [Burkholderiales bacterium]
MRFASLGSGSEGNALVVEAPDGVRPTRVLLDCGFGIRETRRRLERAGLGPEALDAVLVTHEHGDHAGGVARLARAFTLPVYMTYGTWRAMPSGWIDETLVRIIDPHRAFAIGALGIEPFTVPHDAREPVQFVFDSGKARLGVLTDIGHPAPHLSAVLAGLTALVLECNHDQRMLAESDYPPPLKRRIGGHYGHLANSAAAQLLGELDRRRLRRVVAAHLSRQNNRPELARRALAEVLGAAPIEVAVAMQDEGLGWCEA